MYIYIYMCYVYVLAEAEKIKVVKAAEGAADAAQLQGEGIARQRRAIIDGLQSCITSKGILTTGR